MREAALTHHRARHAVAVLGCSEVAPSGDSTLGGGHLGNGPWRLRTMPPLTMNLTPVFSEATIAADTDSTLVRRKISWGAIFAGWVAAMAFQVLFMLLAAGLGFAIYSPLTDSNPISELGGGAIVVQGISAVFSLWFGGWIAGRFTPVGQRKAGWLYGLIVWCASTVAGVLVVAGGAGWMLGDLSKLVGSGLSAAGKPVAAVASGGADLAKDALRQSDSLLASFTEEAVSRVPTNSAAGTSIRAKREMGMALARLFSPTAGTDTGEKRAAVTKVLVDNAGLSQADADKLVAGWIGSYDRLKADLEAAKNAAELKAKEAAEKAAKALAIFSLGAFVAFCFGAASAACGGRTGARAALSWDKRSEPVV